MKVNKFEVEGEFEMSADALLTGWFLTPAKPSIKYDLELDMSEVTETDAHLLDRPPTELSVAGLDNTDDETLLGKGTTIKLVDDRGRAFSVTWVQIDAASEAIADAEEKDAQTKEQVQLPSGQVADVKDDKGKGGKAKK